MSSLCVSQRLFDRALSPPALLDSGILVATGVHFDVFGPGIGDSVWAGPLLWMSVDIGDGERLPVTTAARPLAGGSWVLWFAAIRDTGCGASGSSNQRGVRTVVPGHGGWGICIWIVYTRQGSVAVLHGSLLFRLLLCCLIVVCFLSCSNNLTVTKSLPGLLLRPVHFLRRRWCTVSVYLYIPVVGWHPVTVRVAGPELTIVGSVFAASCRHHGTRPSHRDWSSWQSQSAQTSWA